MSDPTEPWHCTWCPFQGCELCEHQVTPTRTEQTGDNE